MPTFLSDRLPEAASLLILAIPTFIHAVVDGAANANTPDWIGSVTQISAFGLVAWIVYYMFTSWLPAIQASHANQLEAQRTSHVDAMRTIAEAHATAVQAMTKAFQDSLASQRNDLLALRLVCKANSEQK